MVVRRWPTFGDAVGSEADLDVASKDTEVPEFRADKTLALWPAEYDIRHDIQSMVGESVVGGTVVGPSPSRKDEEDVMAGFASHNLDEVSSRCHGPAWIECSRYRTVCVIICHTCHQVGLQLCLDR